MAPSVQSTQPTVGGSSAPPGGDDDDEAAALAGLGQTRRLGRYTLLELLGHGGMGVVFAAYDEELDRKVAIKFVHTSGDPRARAALLAEAQALARLAHPNVIHVYEVGEAGERVFLALEFVRGSTLRAWLRQPRAWPEVVAMFVQAGRGLAAAHQAGLVHCDFKPDNALVGQDGRLRVLDFGLARRQEAASGGAAAPQPTGGGTPGYISPEQYQQRQVDARSDQFSFCVALFEALYGQRPFAGETAMALLLAVVRGELRGAPGEARVPTRLRRAVRRGLARDPADRHPSMAALLTELGEALPRPRARGLWLAAASLSAVVTSGAWALSSRRDDPAAVCLAGVSTELDALWGPTARAAVERAFIATDLPYARDSWTRTARLLDAQLAAWAELRRRSCEIEAGPGAPLRPAARCLERHRGSVAAWVAVLREADAAVVERAVAATAELGDPRACGEPANLVAEDAPELDPARAAAVAEIEGLLASGRALELAGQYDRALTPVLAARQRARTRGLLRLEAAALLRLGLLQEHTGAGEQAAGDLAAAYFTADAVGHRATRAEAAVHLVHVTGGPPRAREEEEAALWARLAEAAAAGLGEGAHDLRAALLQHRSRAAIARDDPESACIDLETALELETRRLGAGHPLLADIHEQLAEALLLAQRDDEAISHAEQAIAVAEATLGAEHPSTARRILSRGQIHEHRGELTAALADDLRALAVWERAYGAHARLIWPLTCAGRVLRKAGRAVQAEPHYARALALAEQVHGAQHPEVARALVELGDLVRALGRVDEALALHTRALEILSTTTADAVTWCDLGETLLADGAPAKAVLALERAHLRPDRARSERARADFALARALHAVDGASARSRAMAEQARQSYRSAGPAHAAAYVEVEAWLARGGA